MQGPSDSLYQTDSNDSAPSQVPIPYSNRRRGGSSVANQNWFARFFHVKPALRVVAFSVPRAKIRKEIYKTLRAWKIHGMDGVYIDREENVVRGRVCEINGKLF